jgi:hypothetical protein
MNFGPRQDQEMRVARSRERHHAPTAVKHDGVPGWDGLFASPRTNTNAAAADIDERPMTVAEVKVDRADQCEIEQVERLGRDERRRDLLERTDGDPDAVAAVVPPLRHFISVEPERARREALVLRAQVDEDLGTAQFTTRFRRDLVMDGAAPGLKPDNPAGADDDVVAERVAASRARLRIFEHVGERGEAGVRVRREGLPPHPEVVKNDDRGGALAQLVQFDALGGEDPAVFPHACGDDGRDLNRHGIARWFCFRGAPARSWCRRSESPASRLRGGGFRSARAGPAALSE